MSKRKREPYVRNSSSGGLESPAPLRTDNKPKLFLERPPGSPPYSQEEFDEMVPEFMHRDFYRSHEGELEAIEPSGEWKAIRARRRSAAPKPEKSQEPLAPLRSHREPEPEPAPAPAPIRQQTQTTPPAEDEPIQPLRGPTKSEPVLPPPEERSSTNLPLVICLLLIVGLFLWREQTRPQVKTEQPLPIPREVPVSKKAVEPNLLGEDNPYPEMSPTVETAPEPTQPTAVVETAPESADTSQENTVTFPTEMEEDLSQPPPATYQNQTEEASAQRAAILERMSEGTVNRSSRESQMEQDMNPAQPDDSSLFPGSETEATPPTESFEITDPSAAQQPPPDDSSLFPGEAPPPSEAPAALPPVTPPPVETIPPPAGQGEPYEIAEPDL